jgi:hypothetical protein
MANDFDSHDNNSEVTQNKSRRTFLHGAVAGAVRSHVEFLYEYASAS